MLWASLAVLAGLATGLQLDRFSRTNPAFAPWVPEPFRRFALAGIAIDSLNYGHADIAEQTARKLVQRRPVPSENLMYLALAGARTGNADLSNRALELSSGRGWRAVQTQAVIAHYAIAQGDWASAFYRAIALWSLDERGPDTARMLSEVEAHPKGRAAAVRWAADAQGANLAFLGWGTANLAADGHALVLAKAAEGMPGLDCRTLSNFTALYLQRGERNAAHALAATHCSAILSRGNADLMFGPDFDDDNAGPYAWHYAPGASVKQEGKPDSGLDYTNPDVSPRQAAWKYLALPPGNYSLSSPDYGTIAAIPTLNVRCLDPGGKVTGSTRLPLTGTTFSVPGDACGVQVFQIMTPGGAQEILPITLRKA